MQPWLHKTEFEAFQHRLISYTRYLIYAALRSKVPDLLLRMVLSNLCFDLFWFFFEIQGPEF